MGSEGNYLVVHRGSSITSWRTTDGAALDPDGRLLVTGPEVLLAERLKAWVRAGLMSEETTGSGF